MVAWLANGTWKPWAVRGGRGTLIGDTEPERNLDPGLPNLGPFISRMAVVTISPCGAPAGAAGSLGGAAGGAVAGAVAAAGLGVDVSVGPADDEQPTRA